MRPALLLLATLLAAPASAVDGALLLDEGSQSAGPLSVQEALPAGAVAHPQLLIGGELHHPGGLHADVDIVAGGDCEGSGALSLIHI